MNIGIIVFSQTGNTDQVGGILQEKLIAEGHKAELESIIINSDARPGAREFQIINAPDVEQYDAIIFGAPVQAFSAAQVMVRYLASLASLQGKKVGCYVTKQLPFNWTGGNRAISQMQGACEAKGASVYATGIIHWQSKDRDKVILQCVENLSKV